MTAVAEQIKVGYIGRDGHESTAYVNSVTCEGIDRYSDIPLILEWRDDAWVQVDDWEWEWRPYDQFYRVSDGKSALAVEHERREVRRNPDCRGGKHDACNGDAWNNELDEPCTCQCDCHA